MCVYRQSVSPLDIQTFLLPLFSQQDDGCFKTVVGQWACSTCSTCSTWTSCVWPNKARSEQLVGHSFSQSSSDCVHIYTYLSILNRESLGYYSADTFEVFVLWSHLYLKATQLCLKSFWSFFLICNALFKFLCTLRARSDLWVKINTNITLGQQCMK